MFSYNRINLKEGSTCSILTTIKLNLNWLHLLLNFPLIQKGLFISYAKQSVDNHHRSRQSHQTDQGADHHNNLTNHRHLSLSLWHNYNYNYCTSSTINRQQPQRLRYFHPHPLSLFFFVRKNKTWSSNILCRCYILFWCTSISPIV